MAVLPPLPVAAAHPERWTRRDPLVWILACWLVTRLLLVVFCPEAIHLHAEEDYIGAAGSYWRRHITLLPPWYFQYSPYEGGSVWVNTLTALSQLIFGERILGLKAPALLLGMFSVGATYRFVEWVAGRAAAVVTGALLLLPPANILIEELKTDGLHYDSTGFLFAGVLAMGTLAADPRPTPRRRLLTGIALGLGLFFSYRCLPAYLAAILAWVLCRDGGPGRWLERTRRAAIHGAQIAAGVAIGVAPHIAMRLALGVGAWGLYDLEDPDVRFRIQVWRIPQRFIEPIWLNPYHEAPTARALPLTIDDVVWVAPVVLGSLVALAVIRAPAFVDCLRGLLPGGRSRVAAAFGAPWLVLLPFALTIATEWNPQGFAWHYYPLYPLVAAALGLLGGAVVELGRRSWATRIPAAILLVAWLPLMAAHARGAALATELRGSPDIGLSRGASDALLTRFLIWNWIPHGGTPQAVRDRLLGGDFDRRDELLAMLGHSLGGRLPAGFDAPLQGWERASFHRGLRTGEARPLVVGPSVPYRWPEASFAAVDVPGDDPCAEAGRAMGAGLESVRGEEKGRRGTGAWFWFGRGLGIGEKVDKDRTDAVFRGAELPYDAVMEVALDAGPHVDAFWRGFGRRLGLGGVLVEHRELGERLDDDALRAVFDGVGGVRAGHLLRQTRRLTRRWFPPAALEGLELGAARTASADVLCATPGVPGR